VISRLETKAKPWHAKPYTELNLLDTPLLAQDVPEDLIMDEIIDKRFERVEKALATLINSISTHNPQPSHAIDLVAADAELSQGLEQCESL
jgi:hypothetical protein